MKSRQRTPTLFISLFPILLWAMGIPAQAQGSELDLSLSKDFGFSAGGQIQGNFTLSANGPADLASVRFELDGQELATINQAPFRLSFSTDRYASGQHQLLATGQTATGRTLQSNVIRVEFLSPEAAQQSTARLVLPILAVVGLIVVLGTVGQLFLGRNRPRPEPGAPRTYGLAGGAICPKCGRPFPRHVFSPNIVMGKLERCPYCGKWSIVPAASREALAAAEVAERAGSQPTVAPLSAEERLRQQIEESRYQ